ncbi:CheR family methyltransferase [Methanospirillum lacunae]|uniref:Chemotaxis protein CheR n=1 Tax=Methanospirillum lacunae TaxID=668570 RepID=A0A2V2NCZ6_9EURY|nr:CheR family methyltransferase [Methanospirillum lacunae]PWR74227.1 chemotaxis protein CheR [Methanospirillum lacunae]
MGFTFFYRDEQTLSTAIDLFIPHIQNRTHINIWSAGCSLGQEPYTFAIMLRERMGPFQYRNVKIFATDIDEYDQFGPIITTGIYPQEDIARIPPDIQEKYFLKTPDIPGNVQVIEEIRHAVEFCKHDLLSLIPIKKGLQLIICKNVLLHFSEDQQQALWQMFWESLDEDGYLLHEQTQRIGEKFTNLFEQPVSNAQIYRKRKIDDY